MDSVAFDFDGTLVDCKTRQIEVLQSILRRKDLNLHDFDTDLWWQHKTNGLNSYEALIKMQMSDEKAGYISTSWAEIVENPEWLDLDVLFENTIPVITKLKESQVKIYIITARKSEFFFLNQLRKLKLDYYVEGYFVVNPINSIAQKSIILSRLKPFIFVGDTENDYYASENSGIKFIAVSTGQRSRKFLKMLEINLLADDLSNLDFTKWYKRRFI